MLDRFELFTNTISEISQYWNKIAANEMKAYGLKGMYAVYLVTLYRNPGGITAANLCEISHKDKAEISRSLSVLEKKGLVKRENVTKNSYRALVKLTPEGAGVAEYVCERAEAVVEAASFGITDHERENFYKTLGRIASNLKTISKEGIQQ